MTADDGAKGDEGSTESEFGFRFCCTSVQYFPGSGEAQGRSAVFAGTVGVVSALDCNTEVGQIRVLAQSD